MNYKEAYKLLVDYMQSMGVDVDAVKEKLKSQHIETPSWGYANGGTRFKVFPWEGAARNIHEKVDDAAMVHSLTGIAPSIAMHIPWDKTDDYDALREYSEEKGISLGAVNPNLFQDEKYKLGSITHPSPSVREEAIAHMVECCEIMTKTGSDLLSLWFADGTNYSGQDSIVARKHRMEDAFAQTYKQLPDGARMLIEYKFFEPAFYHTDLADWGMSYVMASKLGDRAQVLVDTGHHAHGTNIAHIVAFLLDEGKLGGFHFNARRYADDDLIVGTHNPFELYEIFYELVAAGEKATNVAYMIDQVHYIESKVEAMLISVINCQISYAKALLVPTEKLTELQLAGDILGAQQLMARTFDVDVHPLLMTIREEMGLDPDPVAAYRNSGYDKKIAEERGKASGDGGGFPE